MGIHEMKGLRIVIITGLSGSGKSTAMAAFEDTGYYCVDNMPISLLPSFLSLPLKNETVGLAFVMDLREESFLCHYSEVFNHVKQDGHSFEVLFLEADEDILLKRYSQTRRRHPLARDKGVLEGIRAERHAMECLRIQADRVINTSGYTVHELKRLVAEIALEKHARIPMRINILSFGFKYGLPIDADLVFDVRFIDNPYFVPHLKPQDGRSLDVQAYVMNREETRSFLEKYLQMMDYLMPLYEKEGKAYLTFAIGCTGGRHRSVAIACAVYEHMKQAGWWVHLTHRDIEKSASD